MGCKQRPPLVRSRLTAEKQTELNRSVFFSRKNVIKTLRTFASANNQAMVRQNELKHSIFVYSTELEVMFKENIILRKAGLRSAV